MRSTPLTLTTQWELATALVTLPAEKKRKSFRTFFGDYTQQEIREMYGRRSTTGYRIRRTLQLLHKEMEVLSRQNLTLCLMETIIRATSGEPEAVGRGFTALQQANPNRHH